MKWDSVANQKLCLIDNLEFSNNHIRLIMMRETKTSAEWFAIAVGNRAAFNINYQIAKVLGLRFSKNRGFFFDRPYQELAELLQRALGIESIIVTLL